jgi:DNA polymerase (family 10)
VPGRAEELYALLEELAWLTVLDEGDPQSFRARAYENAVQNLRGAPGDVAGMSEAELVALEGVGRSTARKIREYFDTGRIAKLEELRRSYPPEFQRLARLPGLGPKTLRRLRSDLGLQSVDDLRRAIEARALRGLRGLGEKTEKRLSRVLARLGPEAGEARVPIAEVMPVARRLLAELESCPDVEAALYCGSLRRLRPTIGDLDLLVATRRPEAVAAHVAALPSIRGSTRAGATRFSLRTDRGLQLDVRIVEPDQLGAASLYFTGSKAHNIKLRQLALRRGWTLNEYGLLEAESGRVIASRTEEEIYGALGLQPIPPPMREDTGEIEAAAAGELPAALAMDDLRGDLHVHTDASGDGRSPLEEVLRAAQARRYAYLAITDHGEDLVMNGVDRAGLLEQRKRLRELQASFPGMRLLHGVELNIGPEGGLDYDAEFRRSFDWCVAAVHSHFDLDRGAQTRRILAAMRDPSVNVIGHLSGRMIGKRAGIELDVDAVLRGAVETGTAIEINSALPRLDAAWEVLRKARGAGVTFVVSTDAHHTRELERMQWGTQQAQRGWVDPDSVANSWPAERFLAWAASARGPGHSKRQIAP